MISHVVHVGIVETHVVNSASENHHSKLNQSFVGFSSVISGVSIVYHVTLFALFVHPSSSYVILYSNGVHFAIKYTLPLSSAQSHEIGVVEKLNSASAPNKYRYSRLYPSFVTALADAGIEPVIFSVTSHVHTSCISPILGMKKRFKVLGSFT